MKFTEKTYILLFWGYMICDLSQASATGRVFQMGSAAIIAYSLTETDRCSLICKGQLPFFLYGNLYVFAVILFVRM
jgi:hypothetical protein